MAFRIDGLMGAVAIIACALGAVAAFASKPVTALSVFTGWAALWGIPTLLILTRRVPFRNVARVLRQSLLVGTLIAFAYGLLSFFVSGYLGFVGGFVGAFVTIMPITGFVVLLAVGVSSNTSETDTDVFEALTSMSSVEDGRRKNRS